MTHITFELLVKIEITSITNSFPGTSSGELKVSLGKVLPRVNSS